MYPDRLLDSTDLYKSRMAWKWFIVLGELALLMELMIVPYFWTSLWPIIQEFDDSIKNNEIKRLGMILDHSVPLTLIAIDFLFFNANPIVLRHNWIIVSVSIVYLLMNMTVTLLYKPVYPTMTWHGTAIILPFILMLLG